MNFSNYDLNEKLIEVNELVAKHSKSLFYLKNKVNDGSLFLSLDNIDTSKFFNRKVKKQNIFDLAQKQIVFKENLNFSLLKIENQLTKNKSDLSEIRILNDEIETQLNEVNEIIDYLTQLNEDQSLQLLNNFRATKLSLESFVKTTELINKNNEVLNKRFEDYKNIGIPLMKSQLNLMLNQARQNNAIKSLKTKKELKHINEKLNDFEKLNQLNMINSSFEHLNKLENEFKKELETSEKLKRTYINEKKSKIFY